MLGTVKEIEQALLLLSPSDLDAFREWFIELESTAWDRQMENDIASGRLDALADEAVSELKAGNCKEF